jgi:hypothetical protein
MASLLTLSAELKLMIIEHLELDSSSFIPGPSQDLLSLSRVCKMLRALSIPYLIRSITLLNEEKSGISILALLNSADAEHVRDLHYIGIMDVPESPDCQDGPVKEPSPDDLPESVEQVLSSLAKLANLERVTVQFICAKTADEDERIYRFSYDIYEELETDEQVLESENSIAFRSLMQRSYMALSRNPASSIQHLELRNVMAKRCSAWDSTEFHTLLQGVTSFTISLRGGDNGAGWQINKVEGYLDFVARLHVYFFKHLSKVKTLSLAATSDGPPGIDGGMNNAALPLLEQHMPELQHLILEYFFISEDLANFITAHGKTLQTVRLNHCYSGSGNEDAICWGDFFSSVASKEATALRVFDIGPSDLEQCQLLDEADYDYKFVLQTSQLREKFPERRMLDYKDLDDKYGMVFDSEDHAIESFESGSDHSGWKQLCKLIKQNVEKDT